MCEECKDLDKKAGMPLSLMAALAAIWLMKAAWPPCPQGT